MTEAFIPALISGALAIITALVGKQLVSDPLRNVKAKLDAVNDLPDSPRKADLQNRLEATVVWAVEHGDEFFITRGFIVWAAAPLALFIVAGSIIILSYITIQADAAISIESNLASPQVELFFHLILEQVLWTARTMAIPFLIGGAGFILTSLLRKHQIEKIRNKMKAQTDK
ncbi:MAG: hypothetical protein UCL14_02500 [Collinsella sp.]|uniref:hypothetical protein n=1 Tax=Collinsella sp. TaxID=1965294 RepID=UPI002E77F59C|nr:hypothetical protein [Collinsella sp.]MEE0703339.1 hypothetical protein [Collinsella sp.]